MRVNSVNLHNEALAVNGKNSMDNEKRTVSFEDILSKTVEGNTTVAQFARWIETKHNANIIDTSELYASDHISGLNNVIIGGDTLEKMKNNKTFCKKILKVIDDVCSPSAIRDVKSLTPPVKSAGVIIYPDGSYLCWLESVDSDIDNDNKEMNTNKYLKVNWGDLIENIRGNLNDNTTEQINNLGVILNSNYVKRK